MLNVSESQKHNRDLKNPSDDLGKFSFSSCLVWFEKTVPGFISACPLGICCTPQQVILSRAVAGALLLTAFLVCTNWVCHPGGSRMQVLWPLWEGVSSIAECIYVWNLCSNTRPCKPALISEHAFSGKSWVASIILPFPIRTRWGGRFPGKESVCCTRKGHFTAVQSSTRSSKEPRGKELSQIQRFLPHKVLKRDTT